MLLRHYIEQGMSKRAIARKLKISRDTLYRWIREGALERHADEQPVEYSPPFPSQPQHRRERVRISGAAQQSVAVDAGPGILSCEAECSAGPAPLNLER
jgi:transposase-like protein